MASDKIGDGKLRIQQEIFCQEYAVDFNGTQAAIRAGYSERTAQVQASDLLSKPMVSQRINEIVEYRIKAAQVTHQKILADLSEIAQSDLADAFDERGALLPIKQIPVALRKAISEIKIEELFDGTGKDRVHVGYTKTIKLWSKDKSLEQLGRYLKMFVDRVDHTGKITLEDIVAGSWDGDKKPKE